MTDDRTNRRAQPAVSGATTLIEALRTLEEHGYAGQLVARADGTLECARCGTRIPAGDFHVDGFHRFEGASDPDDMNLVVWGRGTGGEHDGAVIIGYGPNATDADQAVLERLDLGAAGDGGSLDVQDAD